ncbi:MAG: CpsD/CapB family tyrosine-protein kinase [Oscillospiraceae bacterium]|nr:CpsD/CapB family tyrosine-protein kinase [Oscillospiraceae bacterium]
MEDNKNIPPPDVQESKQPQKKDIYDDVSDMFATVESMIARSERGSRSSNVVGFQNFNKKRSNKRTLGNMIKTFVDAPFQYQEAILSLRTNINFLTTDKNLKTIVITSAIPGEGKSSVSINLSLALSAAKHRVVLIDADLRRPSIHRYLNLENGIKLGLTNILHSGTQAAAGCLHSKIDRKGFDAIPCGIIPPNPTELLSSTRMKQLIDELSNVYDYVLIDTPPVSVVTDAAVLSRYTDGVIMVLRQKNVTYEQARQAKKNLDAVDANILGVVVNDFNIKHVDKSGGYYNYYRYTRR